ncbi:hypothetical protein M413DRAFT_30618 [Hebeloma cylindrosporum]|uniref:Uncharacterized protein n=1 Tax=Hebeloma cylindrosporum TaxID=76867 RepID=A0A0C2YAC1_HEBCY|nr:hypothetical protein M413DRAFT_30618 [Hebeloma cylindrosporum h7]
MDSPSFGNPDTPDPQSYDPRITDNWTFSRNFPFGPLPYPESHYLNPNPTQEPSESEVTTSESEDTQTPVLNPAKWNDTNMATPVKTMPSRHDRAAPKFDGKPKSLEAFLDDINQLSTACSLTNAEKIKWTVHYAPADESELWKMQPNYIAEKWEEFQKELYALYPGSTRDRIYSVVNLKALTEKQATLPMVSSEQFGEYYHTFCKVAFFLKKKDQLSDREISAQFILGFIYPFRVKVRAQLKAQKPTHHTDDPYTLKEISDIALFLLSCNQNFAVLTEPEVPTVKREIFDASNFSFKNSNISMETLAQELLKHMNLLSASPPA